MMEHIIGRHSPWCNTWGNIHTYLKDRNTVLMHVKCIITVIPHDYKSPVTQILVQAVKFPQQCPVCPCPDIILLIQFITVMSYSASQITSVTISYPTVCSGADQREFQSSASLAFVRGIHLWPVHSPHKWPVTQKMFPFDYITMYSPAFCNQTSMLPFYTMFSTSKPKQNGWHFADYVFKFVLLVCKILYFNSSFTETWSKWSI